MCEYGVAGGSLRRQLLDQSSMAACRATLHRPLLTALLVLGVRERSGSASRVPRLSSER